MIQARHEASQLSLTVLVRIVTTKAGNDVVIGLSVNDEAVRVAIAQNRLLQVEHDEIQSDLADVTVRVLNSHLTRSRRRIWVREIG